MKQERVIALGFFDGVHIGHQVLMAKARQQAERLGCKASVLTFDNHPDELVFGRSTPLINSLMDRQLLLTEFCRMDEIISIPFDRPLMQMPWEEFVDELLVKRYNAVHVVCGYDFSFGYRGSGNPDKLKERCAFWGIGCDVVDAVLAGDLTVSSSVIRTMLQQGEMEDANVLLGHRHILTETVVLGKQVGRTLGVPTANLRMPAGTLAPAYGVYATQVVLKDGRRFMAVTNVGTCPTIGLDTGVTVEAWILDFDEDIYGEPIRVEFCRFLRPEKKFDSLEELKEAIHRDAQHTRDYFAKQR